MQQEAEPGCPGSGHISKGKAMVKQGSCSLSSAEELLESHQAASLVKQEAAWLHTFLPQVLPKGLSMDTKP